MKKKKDKKILEKEDLKIRRLKLKEKQINIRKEREARLQIRKIENKAAVIVQSVFKDFLARKKYRDIRKEYEEAQKTHIAAMKIQYYYRSVKKAREMVAKKERKNKVMKVEK
mmetsp:Transcript_20735/g.18381  ORF Transcript_20735/g.18381 Transcript_20735/m.18381 type:complete len:112 (+) Transcript_20735:322-657(+)